MTKPELFTAAFALSIAQAAPALAYVGPGAGLSALGSVFAFLGVIVLMIAGFFWYPLKRMFSRGSDEAAAETAEAGEQ